MRVGRMAGSFLQAVLVAHGVCLGAAGVGLVREAGAGGLGPEALVSAPGAGVRGVVMVAVALLLLLAVFAGAVGAGATRAGAEAALAAGVVGLAERGAAVLAVTPDPGWVSDHRIVTSQTQEKATRGRVRVAFKTGRVAIVRAGRCRRCACAGWWSAPRGCRAASRGCRARAPSTAARAG